MATSTTQPISYRSALSALPDPPTGDSFEMFRWLKKQLDGTNGLPQVLDSYGGFELQICDYDSDSNGKVLGMYFATEMEAESVKGLAVWETVLQNAPLGGYYDPNKRMALYIRVKQCYKLSQCRESKKASGGHKWEARREPYGEYICLYCSKKTYKLK